jgi:hypothetical protein
MVGHFQTSKSNKAWRQIHTFKYQGIGFTTHASQESSQAMVLEIRNGKKTLNCEANG